MSTVYWVGAFGVVILFEIFSPRFVKALEIML